jgi:hypothetical protein
MAQAVQQAVVSNDQINQAVVGFDQNARNVGDEALKLAAPFLNARP